jgi:hypothetical protein
MSSPHVAGLFALLKQAHPNWSAAEAKSALMTSARQDVLSNDRKTQAGPFDMGSGHVKPGRPGDTGSSFQPGLAVTSVAKNAGVLRYDAQVSAPTGYTVSVSPSSLSLNRGQSATFKVTITNVSAPVDEWRFGSLTWKEGGGNYLVRSPIAVKASQFSAPDEVTGSGVSGSLSFPVQVGYSGAYTAAAHGLVPATPDARQREAGSGSDVRPARHDRRRSHRP